MIIFLKKIKFLILILAFALLFNSILAQDADKSIVIDKIEINNITVNTDDLVIAKTDTIKFSFSLKSNNGDKTPFIFKITIKNSTDSSTYNINRTQVSYFNLPEDNYIFSITAFEPKNNWNAAPKSIKFRVNNKDAKIRKDLDSLKKANIVLDSLNNLKQLSNSSKLNDFSLYVIILLTILIILCLLIVYTFWNKLKRFKGKKMENNEQMDKLFVENANLKAEISALRAQIDALQSRGEELRKQNEELRESLDKLTKSKKEIEELQTQKDDLFAVIIHDIKNPASLIKQLVDLLRSYDLNAMEQQEVINDIFDTTSKIVKLSQEVTRVLALEGSSLKMTYDKVNIAEILKDVCKRNSIAAKKKEIDLLIDINDDMPETYLDIHKIDEVIDNLVSNAIKFNNVGGQVKVSARVSNNQITVEVSDNGQGLTEEDVKKAFNRGVRLSAQPTAGENSSGFGLWIVKKLIEAHNGRVWVKSAIGKGSTFAFSMPIKTQEPVVENL